MFRSSKTKQPKKRKKKPQEKASRRVAPETTKTEQSKVAPKILLKKKLNFATLRDVSRRFATLRDASRRFATLRT